MVVVHGDVFRRHAGGAFAGGHGVDVGHVVVVAQRQADTGRLVTVAAEGGRLARPARHELALPPEVRVLRVVRRQHGAQAVGEGRAKDAETVPDADDGSRPDRRLGEAARVLQADEPGGPGHRAVLAGGGRPEKADLLAPGQQHAHPPGPPPTAEDVEGRKGGGNGGEVIAGVGSQDAVADPRPRPPPVEGPAADVAPLDGRRRPPQRCGHPLEGARRRGQVHDPRPVGGVVAVKDLQLGVVEVGFAHAAPKLQLHGPGFDRAANHERRVIEVRRQEDRPIGPGPAGGDDHVAGSVTAQPQVGPAPRPTLDPFDHPILVPRRGGDGRQLDEPLAVSVLLPGGGHWKMVWEK